MKVAYLGRFQPFHIGHKKVIEEHREEHEDFSVIIGSAEESRTEENPLTAEERKNLIQECFPGLEINEKEDRDSHRKWTQELEAETDADAIISQNDLVKRLIREHTEMKVIEQELYNPEIYSGTEARRRIKSGEEWRYLIPECCKNKMEELTETIKKSGINYEFEPGWKKENAYHSTADSSQ
ncbi:MAG: adenylyltransferase/cytidyltransferase family protein [Candidatus Nanohalobium sp.]